MRPLPYIGVTGFTSRSQVEHALRAHTSKKRLLMAGVLASSKTLRGEKNTWPERYPAAQDIPEIFPGNRRAMCLVHFHSDGTTPLASELMRVASIAGASAFFEGFQLNVRWPNPSDIDTYHNARITSIQPAREIIVLQCGAGAMQEVGNDPVELGKRVAEYEELVDDVLIDPSGGTGKEFDPHFVGACFEEILRRSKTIGVGVAGGLSAETIHLIELLLKRRYKFSIDAEGKIRDKDDKLDIDAMVRYIQAANELFAKYP